MLGLSVDVQARTEARVMPQLIIHSTLLELTDEELEEALLRAADENPALKVVRREEFVYWGGGRGGRRSDEDDDGAGDLDGWVAAPWREADEILLQFKVAAPERLHRAGELLVSALDERGWLSADLDEIAEAGGVSVEELEEALYILQRLEPPGLGARDLRECLLVQLECMGERAPERVREFVARCVNGSVSGMFAAARRELGMGQAEIEEVLEFIRRELYPYPARLFVAEWRSPADAQPPAAQPDVVIEIVDGRVEIGIPCSERVQARIDAAYERLERELRNARAANDSQKQIRERVRQARDFIKQLRRRHETLALVTEAIVKLQWEFFLTGDPERLRPLDQKDVARATGLHESTVCRAVKNKHVLLPDETLVPFEMFFDDALPAKMVLCRLIRREDPARPYSDEQLAELMKQHGYELARRTVTKYRLQLGIPPARKRKRRKAV